MDPVEHQVLRILKEHPGESRRIRRDALRREVSEWLGRNVTDREMRLALENLRANDSDGCMICSSLSGGYYMARSLSELRSALDADKSRISNTSARIRAQERRAGLITGGQLEMGLDVRREWE
jgi:hypothetical protein